MNFRKYQLISIFFWFFVWTIFSFAIKDEVLFPLPASVIKALFVLLREKVFFFAILSSFARFFLACIFAIFFACLFAILAVKFQFFKFLLSPFITAIKTVPVATFIILLFVWFSNKVVPLITSFLIGFPIIYSTVFSAILSVDKSLLEMAKIFNVKLSEKIKAIYIPSILPEFTSALSTMLGLCWKAGIAAEIICSPKNSIGNSIRDAKTYLETPTLFAWIFVLIVLSLGFEKIVLHFLSRPEK